MADREHQRHRTDPEAHRTILARRDVARHHQEPEQQSRPADTDRGGAEDHLEGEHHVAGGAAQQQVGHQLDSRHRQSHHQPHERAAERHERVARDDHGAGGDGRHSSRASLESQDDGLRHEVEHQQRDREGRHHQGAAEDVSAIAQAVLEGADHRPTRPGAEGYYSRQGHLAHSVPLVRSESQVARAVQDGREAAGRDHLQRRREQVCHHDQLGERLPGRGGHPGRLRAPTQPHLEQVSEGQSEEDVEGRHRQLYCSAISRRRSRREISKRRARCTFIYLLASDILSCIAGPI